MYVLPGKQKVLSAFCTAFSNYSFKIHLTLRENPFNIFSVVVTLGKLDNSNNLTTDPRYAQHPWSALVISDVTSVNFSHRSQSQERSVASESVSPQ